MRSGGDGIRRQEALIRAACRRLGTFTYRDVKDRLKARTRTRRRYKDRREFPSDHQIARLLSTAPWCRVKAPGGKRACTVYEYVGGDAHGDESSPASKGR